MRTLLIIFLFCSSLFASDTVIDGWMMWHTTDDGFVFDCAARNEAEWNQTIARLKASDIECDSIHTVYFELVFDPGMDEIQDNITCTTPSDRSTCESMQLYGSGVGAVEDLCGKGVLLAALSALLVLAFTKFTRRS
jgi:hypothetical protein